jgi:hypothetical protein
MTDNELISSDDGVRKISIPDLQLPEIRAAEVPALEIDAARPAETGKDALMLDVHPPHEPIHSWKAYLLHMSTIVLGLLIAIGLEQSVEAIHRARETRELRESLRLESEKALADAQQTEVAESDPLRWINARVQLVETALAAHRPLTDPLPRKPHVTSNLPIDPAWEAAKSSGLLNLLTQQEVEAYSEADILFAGIKQDEAAGFAASYKRAEFEVRHMTDPQHPDLIDLSHATPEELNTYITLLMDEYGAWDQFRVGCQYLRGVETAILAGERVLGRIQSAMRRFYSPDPR